MVQLGLLIYRAIQGHLHQQNVVFYHHSFCRAQHQDPLSFHILENLIPLCLHSFYKFYELQMPFK